ncbi:MAG: NADP oxidoreductase [Rubrobacteridae bacterium]|nr:NADP oxidoreductase [Rubrobacteridae bacterium]
MAKARVATAWLDGCSGCHMSLLDIDELLIDLAGKIELVYSPLVDAKEIPEGIDVAIIEGAVGNEDNLHVLKTMRERSKLLVSLGDCAVTGNITTMRNPYKVKDIMERSYIENAPLKQQIPTEGLPALLKKAEPLHDHVHIDVFVPGCPPAADNILFVISEILEGRVPDLGARAKFG